MNTAYDKLAPNVGDKNKANNADKPPITKAICMQHSTLQRQSGKAIELLITLREL